MSFLDFFRSKESEGTRPRIKRGFRNEGITYEKPNRLLEIDSTWIGGDRLYTETISRWDDGQALSDEEKEEVYSDVLRFLSRAWRRTIVVINTDDHSKSLWEELSRKNSKLVKSIEYDSFEKQREFERQTYLGILESQNFLIINDTKITSTEELDRFLAQERNSE